jgi:hypothetical protein
MKRQTWTSAGALGTGLFVFNAPVIAQSSMDTQPSMTDAQITAKLQAAGYTNVHDVELEGDHYDADATQGERMVHVHVDAKSGAITTADDENENEEHEGYERHQR